MPPHSYTLVKTRQTIILGPELARGGEGAVYALYQRGDLVAKLYHPGKVPPAGKLERMVENPPDDPTAAAGHCSIAWPRDLLRDAGGQTLGYVMPRIGGGLALHGLYNLQSRAEKAPGFNWRYLHVAARNLASAIAAIHAKGYCVGDLNESNILVQPTALLTLVDTDSFQVPDRKGSGGFLCPVGKPDYTAPELQGKDFRGLRRSEEHDRFALAVLLFQILQEGSHPFRGKGEPPELGHRIQRGLFPFVPKSKVEPPPLALFDALAPPLQALFRTAFRDGHTKPGRRPSARDWGKALAQAETELILCQAQPQHLYHRDRGRCTWCERTQALGGRDPFPPPGAQGRALPATPSSPPVRPAVPPVQSRPVPAPAQAQPASIPAPPPLPRLRASVVIAAVTLALLVLSVALGLYWQWTTSAAYLVAQARTALALGDEAAADQALKQAAVRVPGLVAAFSRARADLYRTLAKQATGSEGELRDLALAQAQQWDARADAAADAAKVQTTAPRAGPVGTIAAEMVRIPGGSFRMGCSAGTSRCDSNEIPPHRVTVKPFRLGRYEVTQAQWQAVMNDRPNPARFKGDDRPVENVSWNDIQGFLERLNADRKGKPYRLPTEAEWECAARAGSATPYWWGKDLGRGNANCSDCGSQWDGKETAPVGSFKPNAFGLYDTAGNVWEWVQDCSHDSYTGTPADGSEWDDNCRSAGRVLRGGSWGNYAWLARVSSRGRNAPGGRNEYLGLRLAQDL